MSPPFSAVHTDRGFNTTSGNSGTTIPTTAKPNDVIVRSDDNIYFTDPDTGFYRISPHRRRSAPR